VDGVLWEVGLRGNGGRRREGSVVCGDWDFAVREGQKVLKGIAQVVWGLGRICTDGRL